MNYDEIIELHDYFQPVYDLENEVRSYWKQFITNEKFERVLLETINSLESNEPKDRKSIWLQGTYGTGKTHATAVVKHILFDSFHEIEDFIENLDEQIKFKIKNFRKSKRVFPVVLKGTYSISNSRTLALVIEKGVKNALKKEGIELVTKTDFDKMIAKLESDIINWESIFKGTELEIYGTKEDIIYKLKQGNVEILTKIENILSEKGMHFSTGNITDWLIEVRNELKNRGITDHIIIYWDEFTGILESCKDTSILIEIQNIAELSINKGVYLFIVTHKRPYHTNILREDVEKILGRFKVLDYSMESITTYHIINATIRKKDKEKLDKIKNIHIDSIKYLIEKIAKNEGLNVQRSLGDIFPIHPYTAYLATFIARSIGSTQRSIFNFLYDEKNGFKGFIKKNPGENGEIFLTVDYLWDFFYEEFERMESEKVHTVLEKFKLYRDTLREKGEEYLSVFKGILLLNILYRYIEVGESSLVVPSESNIMDLFKGAIDTKDLISILSYIDDRQIINKTPDNLYLITSSGLPLKEIEVEKNRLRGEYSTIDRILNSEQKKKLEKVLGTSVNRDIELVIMDASLNKHLIRKKIEKAFNKDYTINLCLFFGKNEQEIPQVKELLKEISYDDDLKDIIFVVSEVTLEDKIFERFIEYKARATVADKHNYSEERKINEEYAKKIIDNWIDRIKSGYVQWFLRNETGKELMYNLSRKINEELSMKIFTYGLDNIEGVQGNRNIWAHKKSNKAAEIFLFANGREDIEERTVSYPYRYLRGILKDNNGEYIVDANLRIKENVHEDHPLKKMYLEIKRTLEKERNKGVFNLGDTLRFLTKPPYGLYSNMVNMGAISFIMREYIGKLFETGTGISIQRELMRDKILTLFDYWEKGKHKGKLEVRFGTEDEEKLTKILSNLFNLGDVKSLNDARWGVRKWIKEKGFPIWAFKFAEGISESTKWAIDTIFELIQLSDRELTYEKIEKYLSTIEEVEYDLDVLINRENPERLFKEWLANIERVEISPEEIDEVIDYIRKNMQEEVASWIEDKVREKVKDWYIKKLNNRKNTEEKRTSYREDGFGEEKVRDRHNKNKEGTINQPPAKEPSDPSYSTPKEKVESIEEQIRKCSPEKLREILIEVTKEYPDVKKIIEKYIENA